MRSETKRKVGGKMKHIPYGYLIVDGKAVVDEEKAKCVKTLFEEYTKGHGLIESAKRAGLKMYHGSVGRMLRNTHYLGDDYYPQIIDKVTFDKAEEMRRKKAASLGRVRELKEDEKIVIATQFTVPRIERKYKDPFLQAEYVYSQIESVVNSDE